VVDDEPPVLNVTGALLRLSGYQTVVYNSARRASQEYEVNGASVLISDVINVPYVPTVFVEEIVDAHSGDHVARVRFDAEHFAAVITNKRRENIIRTDAAGPQSYAYAVIDRPRIG
jgi:DNA-binding NtrC family response regulator